MGEPARSEFTLMLQSVQSLKQLEEPQRARLFDAVYQQLRRLAGALMGRRDGTLTPTALVHEAYLRLSAGTEVAWENRAHFLGIAARAMRQVLVDHARAHDPCPHVGGRRRRPDRSGGDLARQRRLRGETQPVRVRRGPLASGWLRHLRSRIRTSATRRRRSAACTDTYEKDASCETSKALQSRKVSSKTG